MQPRLTIQAMLAASVTTGKSAVRPLGEDDVHGVEPVRVRVGHALLVEEVALDAVRVALHLHGPARDVVERVRREVDVVVDEVAFRQPRLGKEDLVRVRDGDVAAADAHAAEPSGANPPSEGRRAREAGS